MAEDKLFLILGDIIEIISPKNTELNNQIFFIEYIDGSKMKLTNETSEITLEISNKKLTNKSIEMIKIISRADSPSYVVQHDLTIDQWILITLTDGTLITGQIVDIEKDSIEVQVVDEENPIYIDFAYKGIPEDLPIESIELIEEPKKEDIYFEKGQEEEEVVVEGEEYEEMEEDEWEQEQPKKDLMKELIETDHEVQFGDIEEVQVFIDLDEKSKRYQIDIQTNDLLENMLNEISIEKRSNYVLNNIHKMIERFVQLRSEYATFNKYKHVTGFRKIDKDWKPLKENLLNLNKHLYWIIPIAKNIKKIYLNEEDDNYEEEEDSEISKMNITILNLMSSLELIEEYFGQYNSVAGIENKYDELYHKLNPLFTPFQNITHEEEKKHYIINKEVESNMDVLIQNNDNFQSFTYFKSKIKTTPFLFQKYNTGLTRLKTILSKGSRLITEHKKLTDNDEITITSFLTCPESVITFSKIQLPTTLLLQKSNLHLHFLQYSKLFHKKTPIHNIDINSLKDNIDFDKDNYVNNIKNFNLHLSSVDTTNPNEIYNKYLNMIIPMTRILFQLIQKYIVGKLSILEILTYLEPFMIYGKDLTYKQYEDIVFFLNSKIKNFFENMSKKEKELNQLRFYKSFTSQSTFYINSHTETLYQLIQYSYPYEELQNIQNMLFQDYQYDKSQLFLSNSELFKKILLIDNGFLYNIVINFNTYMLTYPKDIFPLLEEEKRKLESKKTTNECKNYIIAKRYNSLEELERDNGKEIFFDKKLDKTNYDLMNHFKKEKDKMSPEDFFTYLKKQLKTKYFIEDEENVAETLISGIKKVKEGHYAYYIDNGLSDFYKRTGNKWVKISDKEELFKLNNTEDLCNIQPKCIFVENECKSMELNSNNLTIQQLDQMINDFDKEDISTKDILPILMNQFLYYKEAIKKKLIILKYNWLKNNYYFYLIGQSITDTGEVKKSPYQKLCDAIIGEEDFIKKQTSILMFCNLYTRHANTLVEDQETENPYWLYCTESNVQLIPSFIHRLATIFIENPEKYNITIDQIIKEQGIISDDGEKWVDKYSGYTIKNIDFIDDEGFITGIGLLEEDFEVEKENSFESVTNTKELRIIKNVIDSISFFIGIQLKDQMDFLIRNITKLIVSLPNEKQYNEGKQSKKTSYEDYIHLNILFLTLGVLLVAIQGSIPSIKTKKTFPGCIKSFEGYPLDTKENKNAIRYLSCIVFKIKSKTIIPWNTLSKFKTTDAIEDTLLIYLEKIILKDSEIVHFLEEKRTYLIESEENPDMDEYSLNNWVHFLPPLFPFHIKEITPLESTFKQGLIKSIKDGNHDQLQKIHTIQSKNMFYSLKIQEFIQQVIQKKMLLLKNSYNEPFIENACCNDKTQETIIDYFIHENKEIVLLCDKVKDLSAMLNDITLLTKADIYHSSVDTKLRYPPVTNTYNENTIYLSFIVYCKFNKVLPIPSYLKEICKEKPLNISAVDSTKEIIEKLKSDTFHYTEENLINLINLVNRKNIIPLIFNKLYDPQTTLFYEKIIHLLDEESIFDEDEELLKNMANSIAQITKLNTLEDKRKSPASMNDINRFIQNELIKKNKTSKSIIQKFLKENRKQKENKKNISIVEKLLTHLTDFIGYDRDEEDTLFQYIQFMKNNVHLFVYVFPNIILNHLEPDISIPKYMNYLSFSHRVKLIESMTQHFKPFMGYYHNPIINKVLINIQTKGKDICELINCCPIILNQNFDTEYSSFDKTIVILLMEFLFLKVIHLYIDLTEDITNITIPKQKSKKEKEYSSLEDIEEEYIDFSMDAAILEGDKKELKNNISDMLKTFLIIMKNQKDDINISYDSIMDKIFKIKEAEKSMFTSELKAKTEEERNVDTELKRNKLGRWNRGLQKGLTEYDEKVWEDEENMRDILHGIEERAKIVGQEENMEEIIDQVITDEREDRENYDMGMLSENFMDGDDWEGFEMEDDDWDQQN